MRSRGDYGHRQLPAVSPSAPRRLLFLSFPSECLAGGSRGVLEGVACRASASGSTRAVGGCERGRRSPRGVHAPVSEGFLAAVLAAPRCYRVRRDLWRPRLEPRRSRSFCRDPLGAWAPRICRFRAEVAARLQRAAGLFSVEIY